MSFKRNKSKSKNRGNIPLRLLQPATTFDDLLDQMDTPPPKSKTKTLLQRAGTLTRQILVGPTFDERSKGKGIGETYLANETFRESQASAREAANERLRNLRHIVLCQGKSVREDDIYDLAKQENVYLNPRPSLMKRMKSKDLTKVELVAWVVARVAGPMIEGRYKDHFIFLGRNKVLFAGENQFGADSRPISLEDEEILAHVREISRAYYGLCD
ncbi:hypothetical protein F4679DRAFT_172361 [Xylaria curta]|nr:hypothetical protein F4679DRAFT_172361 [Xylaria curta]